MKTDHKTSKSALHYLHIDHYGNTRVEDRSWCQDWDDVDWDQYVSYETYGPFWNERQAWRHANMLLDD